MKTGLIFLSFLFIITLLTGQCPDRSFVYKRIIYLRDTLKNSPKEQLYELTGYFNILTQCKFTKDSTYALLLQRLGGLYFGENDYLNAILYTRKSISLVAEQKNNPAVNTALSVKSYWNLYHIYKALKLERQSIAALDNCLELGRHYITQYQYALAALENITQRLFDMGDYYKCAEYAQLGESMVNLISPSKMDAENAASIFSSKINSLNFTNRTDEAEKMVLEKISFAEKNKKTELLGPLYGLYGTVLNAKQNPNEAIIFFKKSFDFNKRSGHNLGCAQALNNIGFTYATTLHKNKAALPYYFKAIQFTDANEALNTFDNIANVYVQERKYDSAFYFFQLAFNQISPGFTETDLIKNEEGELPVKITEEYLTGMILDKAAAWLKKYKTTGSKTALEEAIRIYQVTDRYFDKLKTQHVEIQTKLFWKTNNRRLYEQAIEACHATGNTEMAFYFFEKSRSALLNDEISEQQKMSESDLAKQAQLKKNRLELERILKNSPTTSNNYLKWQQQLFNIKKEQELLLKNINNKYAPYARNIAATAPLIMQQVKNDLLNSNKSLLEIFTGDSAVYILSITVNHTSFIKLNKQNYDSLTTAYISYITNDEKSNKNFKDFLNISHQLYQFIFKNIQVQPAGSLIISPDGKSFPFEALLVSNKAGVPDYLFNHYATSYTYSAKYLMNGYAENTKNRNSLLGIAPVKYRVSDSLADLRGSDLSLKNIKNEFSGGTNFVFENATKNNFLQHFPDYAIVQLYTHAAENSATNDPVIYFADGELYLSEVINSRKPITQLVVLSACETANGKLYEGEGIFSFNRGFAALGIPAAISNLWSVENESTYRITELFYKYLAQDFPTDIALQKAKLEFIKTSNTKSKQLPYFWAGTILTGKVTTIKTAKAQPWKIILITTFILAFSGYIIRKRWVTKKRVR